MQSVNEQFDQIFGKSEEYERGERDCQQGKPAQEDGEEYRAGYGHEYAVQQVRGASDGS